MSTPTHTPRPALKATGMRRRHARCLETELAAAKECVAIANRSADDQMHQKREAQTELARLRGRAERAEAERDSIKQEIELVEHRAYRAEADAAAYLKRAESFREIGDEAEAELATERARLDWLDENAGDIHRHNNCSFIWFAHQHRHVRAAIDAAMKEDAIK